MISNHSTLLYTTRNEVDGPLEIIEGNFPADIHGDFYVIYPVGSVNSGGLPFPKKLADGNANPEYGSPIMNGDGYIVRINLQGMPTLKARIVKSPSYYADYYSRYGTPHHRLFGFTNMGISRMSFLLGSKNPLNTALTPFNTINSNTCLVAGYDVGRPFLLDAETLELTTPIGMNDEWVLSSPGFLPWPFPFIQTTAHPSFDARTKELFIVNYSSHNYRLMNNLTSKKPNKRQHKYIQNKFMELLMEVEEQEIHTARAEILNFFHSNFGHAPVSTKSLAAPDSENVLQLMRFTGAKNEKMKKWRLKDQNDSPIIIKECMHQTALTKDFIVLSDTSFKFSLDLLINNFFPNNPDIERLIRKILSKPMLPYTECYIVKRGELAEDSNSAVAYKLSSRIPVETIHYSCNYANPEGKITLYGMHNAAMCIAEWIRTYDKAKLTGKPVDEDYISIFALGNMDISRLGKWVIDTTSLSIVEDESKEYVDTGHINEELLGPNTWSIGLYAFRNMISADTPVDKIDTLWFTSNGISNKLLTEFIYDLYKNYPNRKIPLDEMLRVTQQEVPSCLARLDTGTMTAQDYYQCKPYVYLRSIQHIPGKNGCEYIFATVQNGNQLDDESVEYRGEYWIFDAQKLAQGPICRMVHPEVNFCFTLHSCWLPVARPNNMAYKLNIRSDFNPFIKGLSKQDQIQRFFETNIYPHFE